MFVCVWRVRRGLQDERGSSAVLKEWVCLCLCLKHTDAQCCDSVSLSLTFLSRPCFQSLLDPAAKNLWVTTAQYHIIFITFIVFTLILTLLNIIIFITFIVFTLTLTLLNIIFITFIVFTFTLTLLNITLVIIIIFIVFTLTLTLLNIIFIIIFIVFTLKMLKKYSSKFWLICHN